MIDLNLFNYLQDNQHNFLGDNSEDNLYSDSFGDDANDYQESYHQDN